MALAAAAPAAAAVTGTRVFPAASSKGVAEAPASSAGTVSAAVPAAAPATGGIVFPTTSVGGAARAPASAEGTAALTAAPATGGTVPSAASVGRAPASLAVAAASAQISAAEPVTSGTVPSAASIRGVVGARESSAGAVSSDAAAEAATSTGVTAAPVASAARAARVLTSAAGSAGNSWVGNICGERGASTHPFDPDTVFSLEVRYSSDELARYNGSWLQHGSSSSSNSSSDSSSSSNDNASDHDSWWDATCVGALLRPFGRGKRCRQSTRRGKPVLDVALPFDRGKEWGRMQHGGRDGLRAEGETKDEREQTPLARVLKPTPSFQERRLCPYNRRMFAMKSVPRSRRLGKTPWREVSIMPAGHLDFGASMRWLEVLILCPC